MKLFRQFLSHLKASFQSFRSYFGARFGPKATVEIQRERRAICDVCERKVEYRGHVYCGACGCPKSKLWPDARLSRKAAFQRASCPLEKWPQ